MLFKFTGCTLNTLPTSAKSDANKTDATAPMGIVINQSDTENNSVVSAYIQTATEEYIIIIDNTLFDMSLEIAHPYTISELKDLITE